MRKIAIEGLDGSGKTTVAQELAKVCESEGMSVAVVAPYRLANEAMETDIYPLWKSTEGGLSAVSVIKNILQEQTRRAEAEGTDLIIFDRHWMTAFTEIDANPVLVKAWGEDFIPTAYLRVDPETARGRADNDKGEVWMDRHNYDNYAQRYKKLCQSYGKHLLGIYRNDDDVSPNTIARNIIWDMNVLR